VGSKGSAYANFQRALATSNLMLIRAAASELPAVDLDDALTVCALICEQEPHRYEQAAVRWIGRFCTETRDGTLANVQLATSAFVLLRGEPEAALRLLRALAG
jgi:hypothetical protein